MHPIQEHAMIATCHSLHTPAPVALWHALARAARRCTDSLQRQRLARMRQRELLNMCAIDDHLLRDLGIDRNELLWLAAQPDDPTRARSAPQA
jgi:uncharacterized protein YjiS (DUF1127 family)